MTLRIAEIQRVLKSTGSFYLHCDPTASHYLKLILDAIFFPKGGVFQNEIIWHYESGGRATKFFSGKHDVIFFYTKSDEWKFNADDISVRRDICQLCDSKLEKWNNLKKNIDKDGRIYRTIKSAGKIYKYYDDEPVLPADVWLGINHLQQKDPERLGYPTQKPRRLLDRIIKVSSDKGDIVLDAYCGCGTTIVSAERLKRKWIGIDITYQSISVILRRLEDIFSDRTKGYNILDNILLDGIPKDLESARALANKKDDRLRKEFENGPY
jgi:site-specific DNA-methyltransferase (adenine-specific)